MLSLRFSAIDSPAPEQGIGPAFHRRWPAYQAWYLRDGNATRADLPTCQAMLLQHMPELFPIYERLVASFGADKDQARFLTLWCPPDIMHGCTQALWPHPPRTLIRSYDYRLESFDALLLRSAWHGNSILAMGDCIWGVLDGMNQAGLAVSLAFGGRRVQGPGFGVTLVLRYILQTCRTTTESLAVLNRIPVHLPYNIALLDCHGGCCSVAIAPDRPLEILPTPYSANRQSGHSASDDHYAGDSAAREAVLATFLDDPAPTEDGLAARFLYPPIYRPVSAAGWGTLYTAAYCPDQGVMELRWPGQIWRQTLADFTPRDRLVCYTALGNRQ